MSRIRTVKPDFWVSEQVLSCSPLSRLLFIGMWNFCDDHGIHPASYVRLRAEVFPGDNHTLDDLKGWINELINQELVREYTVENKQYWIVTGWHKHQRIDRPTYKHPLPLSGMTKISESSSSNQRSIADGSTTPQRALIDSSTTERNGMDRNGKDKNICEAEASPLSSDLQNINNIFTYWQQVMNHPRAKLDKKRNSAITQALELGYTVNELKQAIDGCAKTPFNMGQNDSNQCYDDIGLILRDATHIDRFIKNNATNQTSDSNSVMAGVL